MRVCGKQLQICDDIFFFVIFSASVACTDKNNDEEIIFSTTMAHVNLTFNVMIFKNDLFFFVWDSGKRIRFYVSVCMLFFILFKNQMLCIVVDDHLCASGKWMCVKPMVKHTHPIRKQRCDFLAWNQTNPSFRKTNGPNTNLILADIKNKPRRKYRLENTQLCSSIKQIYLQVAEALLCKIKKRNTTTTGQ